MSKKEAMRTGMMALLQPAPKEQASDGAPREPSPPESERPSGPDEPVLDQIPAAGAAQEPSGISRRTANSSIRPVTKPGRAARGNPELLPPSGKSGAGTIERPVLRQRDGRETRKIGVVLPVELLARLDTCCAQPPKMKVNLFIEQAIEEALKRGRD